MESLFILIPVALFFLTLIVLIFFWAVRSGQFEDLDTEARRILFEEDSPAAKPAGKKEQSETETREPHNLD
ncbi:MAG: cbb3-type cytochrome oxidase assembly protein CcoS [Cellvibrionaceae bacterium]|nr:cbb3-type cytochrome oxidase assembly protein CcoS [Cellvibrionaceae bacterium]